MTTFTLTPFQQQFLAARDRSVPLVVIDTPDPSATVRDLRPVCLTPAPDEKPAPLVQWDVVNGYQPASANEAAKESAAASEVLGGARAKNPVTALINALQAPPHSTIVFTGINDAFHEGWQFRQALWNLRDPFKKNHRTFVGTQFAGGVPAALEHDILMLHQPLPNPEELAVVVRGQFRVAKLEAPADDVVKRAVDAVAGLSLFAAEQALILSMRRSIGGLDFGVLRHRHRQMIENTKGLTVWQGGETFAAVGGLANYIRFMRRFLNAAVYRPGAVFFIDEIEKALAGVKGDLTGISQDYLSTLLQWMNDGSIPGILLMGHPGTGKSLLAKATGNEAGVPTIRADMGAMHGSLVGESQHALRHGIKVTDAVAQGRPLVIATCNSVAVLPPELVNRFKWRFFVDLPTAEEKAAIWPIQLAALKLDAKQKLPEDNRAGYEWNGREIEQCCQTAHHLKCSLLEASEMVVPVSQSSAEAIERRRQEAHGRYLSASHAGPFGHEPRKTVSIGGREREVTLREDEWVAPGSGKAN